MYVESKDQIREVWNKFDSFPLKYNSKPVNSRTIRLFLEFHLSEKIVEWFDPDTLKHWDAFSYFSVTRQFIGFVTPTLVWARELKRIIGDKTVLEVGAGTGLVAKYLHEAGVNIIATDDYSWHKKDFNQWKSYFPVENLDFKEAIKKYKTDFLLTCWPMYENPLAREAAELFTKLNPDGKILYIGEGEGGCTADDEFFRGIEIIDPLDEVNSVYPQWSGLHDECWLVKWIGIDEKDEE